MTLEVPHIKYNVQGLGDALEKHQLETVIRATTSSVSESSPKLRQRKGKEQAVDNANSDSSSGDSSSHDEEENIPTPNKKPSGIERLQRGRKKKATSPAGRNYPTRILF